MQICTCTYYGAPPTSPGAPRSARGRKQSARRARPNAVRLLGGNTCLTLFVSCGLVCVLRHYLSNTANLICGITRHV